MINLPQLFQTACNLKGVLECRICEQILYAIRIIVISSGAIQICLHCNRKNHWRGLFCTAVYLNTEAVNSLLSLKLIMYAQKYTHYHARIIGHVRRCVLDSSTPMKQKYT